MSVLGETESRTLREREANARLEQERRARARQRIERELQRTQQELQDEENEEEDDFKAPPVPQRNSTFSPAPPPLPLSQPPLLPPSAARRGSLDSLLNPYESPRSPGRSSAGGGDQDTGGQQTPKSSRSMFDRKWQMLNQVPEPRQNDRFPPFKPSHSNSALQSPTLNRTTRSNSEQHQQLSNKLTSSLTMSQGDASSGSSTRAAGPRTTNVYASKPPELGLSLVKSDSQNTDSFTSAQQYAKALRKSTEKLYGSRDNIFGEPTMSAASTQSQPRNTTQPQSQQPKKSSSKKKNKQRRHTVGGSSDLEHFKALVSVVGFGGSSASSSRNTEKGSSGSPPSRRPSAWERLQPVTPNDDSRDVQSWLQRQKKLRQFRSTPSLIDPLLFYRHQPTFSPSSSSSGGSRRHQQHEMMMSSSSGSTSPTSQPTNPSQPFTFESSI